MRIVPIGIGIADTQKLHLTFLSKDGDFLRLCNSGLVHSVAAPSLEQAPLIHFCLSVPDDINHDSIS
jgi:hypothetical protein